MNEKKFNTQTLIKNYFESCSQKINLPLLLAYIYIYIYINKTTTDRSSDHIDLSPLCSIDQPWRLASRCWPPPSSSPSSSWAPHKLEVDMLHRSEDSCISYIACRRRRFNDSILTWPDNHECQHVCVYIYTSNLRIGGRWGDAERRHGAGADEAGGAGGGGDPRRRRHNIGGVVHLPAVPVLLQVEPWDMPDDHLLLQLQVRSQRQVQTRAGQMRLRRRQIVGRSPAV